MWKNDSLNYIGNNGSSSLTVRLSAFVSALFLSLLCGLFYNAWKYEVERIVLEEGGWQSRIIGEFDQEEIEAVRNYASVKIAVVNEKESKGRETAVDLYFEDYGRVLADTPRIAELAGVLPETAVYNYQLLAMYLIRDSKDTAPRLVFPLFILITALSSFSLIVIIHNAFAVSMNARIHQLGIFSSVGATPGQIRKCLLQEAAVLCAVPLLTGNLLGIAGSMGLTRLSNLLPGSDIAGRHGAAPGYHPLVFVLTWCVTVATIWISAWLPAGKLSRLTPLEAMKNTEEIHLKRRRNSPFLRFLFGVEGELAGNALKAQKKALRTASWSFVLSSLAFTIMQCFFTLSGISTRETYFARYQNVWDIMVTVKDADVASFAETEEIQGLTGAESVVVYQKAAAKRMMTEEEISEEMKGFGGFSHAPDRYVHKADGGWMVNAPIVIMDDQSFWDYCEQIGILPRLDGAVILNRIRDVTNQDFRHPVFLPYIGTQGVVSVLRCADNEEMTAEIPVLSYTDEVPVLREEYATLDYYELVHFMPVSLWKEVGGQIGGTEADLSIRVLGGENVTQEGLHAIQDRIELLIGRTYGLESENRIQEYDSSNRMIQGMMAIFGGFCVLLAMIGIGNVFSNTLGFVRQRKRELARYLSVGLTPGGIRKMFCIEAAVIACRPILLTLPPAVIAVGYMLKMSYVDVGEFLAEAPFVPIAVFMLAVLCAVASAYFLAWRNVRKINLAEALRDDTFI